MVTAYSADNVGGLLRPPELLQARAAHEQGRLTLAQLRQSEDTAILQALELQRQVGLDVCTDGEYRRAEFRSVFDQTVEGLVPGPAPVRPGPGPDTVWPSMVIGARIRPAGPGGKAGHQGDGGHS
jgi:methionine synthase II (cobalamin-independent)